MKTLTELLMDGPDNGQVVFACSLISNVHLIAQELTQRGISVGIVTGGTKPQESAKQLEMFQTKEVQVLVGSTLVLANMGTRLSMKNCRVNCIGSEPPARVIRQLEGMFKFSPRNKDELQVMPYDQFSISSYDQIIITDKPGELILTDLSHIQKSKLIGYGDISKLFNNKRVATHVFIAEDLELVSQALQRIGRQFVTISPATTPELRRNAVAYLEQEIYHCLLISPKVLDTTFQVRLPGSYAVHLMDTELGDAEYDQLTNIFVNTSWALTRPLLITQAKARVPTIKPKDAIGRGYKSRYVRVPRIPVEDQLGGLGQCIMVWLTNTSVAKTREGLDLVASIREVTIPSWLERRLDEFPDDVPIPTQDVQAWIYQAMVDAYPNEDDDE